MTNYLKGFIESEIVQCPLQNILTLANALKCRGIFPQNIQH